MSARNVFAALDDEKYLVELAYIDKAGKWWLVETIDARHTGCPQLLPVLGHGQFVTLPIGGIVRPDVMLPVLHGQGGEDGSVQGLAQLLHIPIVGCNLSASTLCWDKSLTKAALRNTGIKTVPHILVNRQDRLPDYNEAVASVGTPFFVKPTKGGSSVGVSKVSEETEYSSALDAAFKENDILLIEKAIIARELEVAVLGNIPDHKASGVGEIKTDGGFYSYDSKYDLDSAATVTAVAYISSELTEQLRANALKIFETLGCSGLARVDFFVDETDEIYLNEVNTLPGFTNISQYPKLWQQQGVSYGELIDKLIQLAV